jgi:hypothetical protein
MKILDTGRCWELGEQWGRRENTPSSPGGEGGKK